MLFQIQWDFCDQGKLIDQKYSDLIVVLSRGRGASGAFGVGGTAVIWICALRSVGPDGLDDVIDRMQQSVIEHEFVHYLDWKRTGKVPDSKVALDTGGDDEYFNSPWEFNTFFQTMVSAVETAWTPRCRGDWERFKGLARRVAHKEWLELTNPKYARKFLKRLYQTFVLLSRRD